MDCDSALTCQALIEKKIILGAIIWGIIAWLVFCAFCAAFMKKD